jgi:3-methylcrotonyl-CoA carboxylase alpha subunit
VKIRDGERTHEIVVHGVGDETEVTVDGRRIRVRVQERSRGVFVLQGEKGQRTFHCVRDGDSIHLFWEGRVQKLLEEREGVRSAPRGGAGLEAPMPGRVTAVRVSPGETVKKGQELLVVEAMKMENALRAPRDGRVKGVYARPGEMVSPGVVLVELD